MSAHEGNGAAHLALADAEIDDDPIPVTDDEIEALRQRIAWLERENAALLRRARRAPDTLTDLRKLKGLQDWYVIQRRHNDPFALLYVDVDDFKPVNDRHGHEAGSQLLRRIALAIDEVIRGADGDEAFRVGGDEFVVGVRHGNAPKASEIAARIRDVVTDVHAAGCSIGVASYPDDGAALSEIVGAADRRMRDDKRARGRGR